RQVFPRADLGAVLEAQVQHLPLDDPQCGVVQLGREVEHRGRVDPGLAGSVEHQVAPREERVASVDCPGRAPQRPDGRPEAAQLAPVLDVVVDQREVVDHLDRRGDRHGQLAIAAERLAAHDAQARADALAGGGARRNEALVELSEVIADEAVERQVVVRTLERRGFDLGDQGGQGLFKPLVECGRCLCAVQGAGPSRVHLASRAMRWRAEAYYSRRLSNYAVTRIRPEFVRIWERNRAVWRYH